MTLTVSWSSKKSPSANCVSSFLYIKSLDLKAIVHHYICYIIFPFPLTPVPAIKRFRITIVDSIVCYPVALDVEFISCTID